ncbi:hypothetical protein D9M70_551910 [compost metagenome]
MRGLRLPLGNTANTGAHDLGDEGRGIERERQEQRQEFRPDDRAAGEVELAGNGNVEGDRRSRGEERQEWQADDQAESRPKNREALSGGFLLLARIPRHEEAGDDRDEEGKNRVHRAVFKDRFGKGETAVVEEHVERQCRRFTWLRQDRQNAAVPEEDDEQRRDVAEDLDIGERQLGN